MEGAGCSCFVKVNASVPINNFQRTFGIFKNRKNSTSRFGLLIPASDPTICPMEVAANMRWIDPFITASPVNRYLFNLQKDGLIYRHMGITISETVIGFVSGTILGTLIAIVLWWSDFLSRVLDPYLIVLNSLPKVALGPIIIVFFGAGYAAILTMALLVSLFTTIIGVFSGLKNVDREITPETGANKKQVLQKVVLPASFPHHENALRIMALDWGNHGEFLVWRSLGYLIVYTVSATLDTVMTR